MVGEQERPQTTQESRGPERCYYSPRRVRYWLEHWTDLGELAVPTEPGIRYDRPSVQSSPRPTTLSHHAEIRVDIERAAISLHRWSLEYQMVEWSMRGYDLVMIAEGLGVSIRLANQELKAACEFIALRLGWQS